MIVESQATRWHADSTVPHGGRVPQVSPHRPSHAGYRVCISEGQADQTRQPTRPSHDQPDTEASSSRTRATRAR